MPLSELLGSIRSKDLDLDIDGDRVTVWFGDRPEARLKPASLVLLGTGLVGVGIRRWRKRHYNH
jgi:hypothetical protein